MDVSDEYIRGERECNTFTVISLYLQKKTCFRQLYLSRTRVKYIFRPFTLSPNQNMFPTIILVLNESEIHFPSFHSTPNKYTFSTNTSEAEKRNMYSVLSFISKRKSLFLTIIFESNETRKRSPSFHSISKRKHICFRRMYLRPNREEHNYVPFCQSIYKKERRFSN